jgi:hypothetical protein
MKLLDETMLCMEENTYNANTIKDMILAQLWKDNLLSEEVALSYMEEWQIIIVKNSWFKRWCDKFKKEKESYSYKFVKFE